MRAKHYVNVIVADKQPHLVYLDMEAAIIHCTKGIGSGCGPATTAVRSRMWWWQARATS